MSEWSYCFDGQNHHKISEEQLIELLATGKLAGFTMVWTEGMDEWLMASDSRLAEHVLETAICSASGRVLPKSEMLQYGEHWIAPEEKENFVANLMEDGKVQRPIFLPQTPYPYQNPVAYKPKAESPIPKATNASRAIIVFTVWTTICAVIFSTATLLDADAGTMFLIIFLLGLLRVVCLFFPVLFFCIWLHRCALNCQILKEAPLKISPGMAVSWYFIPLWQLWMPFTSMKEVWSETFKLSENQQGNDSSIIGVWWWLSITGILLFLMLLIGSFSSSSPIPFVAAELVGAVTAIVACRPILRIISRISDVQAATIIKHD